MANHEPPVGYTDAMKNLRELAEKLEAINRVLAAKIKEHEERYHDAR